MQALILAAGYATRLYPLTENQPKPLLEIDGLPMIDHIVEKIGRVKGCEKIIVVSNAKFIRQFQEWARNSYFKNRIKVINDHSTSPEDRLGAIGDIKYVLDKQRLNDDLLIVGGDNLFTFELSDFIRFAAARRPACSVGLYDIKNRFAARRYGTVLLDKDKRIKKFLEKADKPASTLVSMCVYYLSRESLKRIDEYMKLDNNCDAPGHYIGWLAKQEPVLGYVLKGEWYDIGDIISFYHANVTYRKMKKVKKGGGGRKSET